MNTPLRKSHFLFLVLSLAALALITSACSFHPLKGEVLSQTVDVTIPEDLLDDSQPSFTIHDHDFWEDLDVDVNRLELHDGYIRFLGTQVQPDGSRVDCTIDVSLGVEDGMLTAKVISLDVPGITLTDPVVVKINQDMEATLSLEGFTPGAGVEFQEVVVTEDELEIKVQVTVRF
jgi:hypothetical protein